MPIERRLIPPSRNSENLLCSNVPGFASSVTSIFSINGINELILDSKFEIDSGENKLGVPPQIKIDCKVRPWT